MLAKIVRRSFFTSVTTSEGNGVLGRRTRIKHLCRRWATSHGRSSSSDVPIRDGNNRRNLISISGGRVGLATLISTSYYKNIAKLEPKTMKLDSPSFRAILTPEVKLLSELFQKYNYELRIAGGAVRDLLMDQIPHDVDFATTATPEQMKEMFQIEGIRMLNMKGEKHGTITARLNDAQNFEVTTLRIDVVTDGRRAQVQFTTDWQLDANRRDLTINALFMGFDGTVYDYFHGVEDVRNRNVLFVGDATQRIQEDYLRILRYFRFYGRISVAADSHKAEILEAIGDNLDGLKDVSGPRLWSEFKKILVGNHSAQIVPRMMDLGMAPFLGLPAKVNISEFLLVHARATPLEPHAVTLLAALLRTEQDVTDLHGRLNLSNYERDLCYLLVRHRGDSSLEGGAVGESLRTYQLMVFNSATRTKVSDLKEQLCELFKYRGLAEWRDQFRDWQIPKFPVSGHRLIEAGVVKGPLIAKVVVALRDKWVQSDFRLTDQQLMEMVPQIVRDISTKK